MNRFLFPILLVIAVVFGAPYAAALIDRVIGPWSSTAIESDGTLTHMRFDPDLPRPEWVPFYPGATVVGASRSVGVRMPSGVQSLDLATRASFDEVKRFYTERLAAAGFEVEDRGMLLLNPLTARMLGLDGVLSGRRFATDDRIDIQIRTADGLVPSRLLQIHWRKISETPERPIVPPPAPPPAGKS